MSQPLLSVRHLGVKFKTDEGLITTVEDIGFDLRKGEILGLVGESGSGKSVTAKSIMRLNGGNTVYDKQSQILLNIDGNQVDAMKFKKAKDMLIIRGGAVSMVFQEPMASFAPALTIGKQMVEQLMIHTSMNKIQAKELSVDMLARVGIPDPHKRFDQYAFEFSGGMRQRAMIAMALSTKPKILIADEPTTALDVTIQVQVLDLIKSLVSEFGMAVLLITHDLGVIAQSADRVAVMYLGRLVEDGPVREVIKNPKHPYTQALINALPRIDNMGEPLTPIKGDIPSPLERPTGCVFHTRCEKVIEGKCSQEVPPTESVRGQHRVACFACQPETA